MPRCEYRYYVTLLHFNQFYKEEGVGGEGQSGGVAHVHPLEPPLFKQIEWFNYYTINYRVAVAKNSKSQTFAHIVAKYWPIFDIFTGTFCGKFVIKWLLNIAPHLNCVAANVVRDTDTRHVTYCSWITKMYYYSQTWLHPRTRDL